VRKGDLLAQLDVELLDHQIRTAPDLSTQLHLQRERERQTLRAPIDGWVVRTLYEPGEQVAPGAPVVVVADWRDLTLKVYLSEDRFGRVAIGQSASVTVDAYPGETFTGAVTFIASEAEFTPRNVQTREDRVKSVYAVKLRVPNQDLRLKPGMFADGVFATRVGGVSRAPGSMVSPLAWSALLRERSAAAQVGIRREPHAYDERDAAG
jgi:multidrug efflux pump subunit AcrA (membrane-fusion protein)